MQIDRERNPQPKSQDPVSVFDPHRWLIDFDESSKSTKKSPPSGAARRRSQTAMMMWNLISSVMDVLFVLAFTGFFLWGVGQILNSSAQSTLLGLWRLSHIGSTLLFFSLVWVYYVAIPALFTYTLGQWACQITRTPSKIDFKWLLQSTLRLAILFGTGFVVLPLISWLFIVDLEEELSGLKLYSK